MLKQVTYPLTIFYDGACGVCSTEMKYYRSIADQRIVFIDISSPDFIADQHGRDNNDFQRELHVMDASGKFYTGVEAFRALWVSLPSPFYPLLAKLVGLPGINLTSRVGYSIFARLRHFLPSTKSCRVPDR
jgi:predicted DCC family thiol-disulfide oxidoreductase YuxK